MCSGQRADDIGKIIEVIDDLAEQTNLLALKCRRRSGTRRRTWIGFAVGPPTR